MFSVAFVSNYYTHHQSAFASVMYRLTNGNFIFVETEDFEDERVKLGWKIEKPDYVKKINNFRETNADIIKFISECDVVIIGSAPLNLLKQRFKNNNLTFVYSERIYKKGFCFYKLPFHFCILQKKYGIQKPLFLLAASAYASYDYSRAGVFINKAFKWGYFPEAKRYEDIEGIISSKEKNSILWAGRFLDWKHPDAAIRAAKKLKENGYKFELNIIGTGAMEQELKKMISDYNLENEVHMLGSMKPEQVREYMEQSQIYLFTSDRNEGWGAVLNESMNSACAVVASHEIGSVPFLLKDGKNGFIYKDGDEEDLYRKVKLLLDKPDLCRQYGSSAYSTIINEWSAETAAERFIELAESILSGNKRPDLFTDGPCSIAKKLKDGWYIN